MKGTLLWSLTQPTSLTIIFDGISYGPYFSKMQAKAGLQNLCGDQKKISVDDAELTFKEIKSRKDFPDHTEKENFRILMLNMP